MHSDVLISKCEKREKQEMRWTGTLIKPSHGSEGVGAGGRKKKKRERGSG